MNMAMYRYCRGLSRSASDALQDGLNPADVVEGLLGTIAMSVHKSGGNDGDVAETFRTLAECYENDGQHCPALREASTG